MTFAFAQPQGSKAQVYCELTQMAEGLFTDERDPIANAANLAALVFHNLPDLNWTGFYFIQGNTLVLGPFQGQPACVRIPVGEGVCGTAVAERKSILVPDVQAFPSHIACDAASRSELVVSLFRADNIVGVLDLDSPLHARFDEEDQLGCERLAALWCWASDITALPGPRG